MAVIRRLLLGLAFALVAPFAFLLPVAAAGFPAYPDFGTALPPMLFEVSTSIHVDALMHELTAVEVSYDGAAFKAFGERAGLHDRFMGGGFALDDLGSPA